MLLEFSRSPEGSREEVVVPERRQTRAMGELPSSWGVSYRCEFA
jgi:hypothetical protein